MGHPNITNTPLFQGGQNFDSEFWIHLRMSKEREKLLWEAHELDLSGLSQEEADV